ncbi:MAG: porin family protein [Chitinophagaceae bacterium]
MQPLNYDMDQLMQKAAEDFEVPVAGADWEKVVAQLNAGDTHTQHLHAKALSRRYGLLLLFLMASLVCNKYLFKPLGSKIKTNTANAELVTGQSRATDVQVRNKAGNKLAALIINSIKGSDGNVSLSFYENRGTNFIKKDLTITQPSVQNEITEPVNKNVKHYLSKTESGKIDLQNAIRKTSQIPFVNEATFIDKNSSSKMPETTAKKKKGRFFLGVAGGPDISFVKNDKNSEVGYSVGLIGGYRLNDKWAVETGVFWDKKNYYSSGKHFNTGKMNLPSHTNIIYAEGYCHMLEIPLNLRYNFAKGKKHNWFAAAGASSYIMQNEEYHYLYERYNVPYYGSKNYKADSRNWFSVANISAGFEYKIKNDITIRLEPYLKLPLSGLGIGSLPITSTGVLAGVTYPIQ